MCVRLTHVDTKYATSLSCLAAPDEAALLEPLGVSHNAIEQLEVKDEDVLIVGCGPIGCLACSVAKSMGAKR